MEHNVYEVLKAVWPEWQIVGKPLGSGSFSTVYKVERKDFVRDAFAALKVVIIPDEEELADLKAQRLSEDEISQTLKRHVADYAAEIRHMYSVRGEKNVVFIEDYQVYEVKDNLTWYLLIRMELLTPLNTYLSEHPMTESDVVRLGLDLSTALAACREKHLVHRDIARKNIFVDEEGNFKLGDFGVARTVDRSTRVSSAGTPSYMAPEVIKATMIRSNIDAAARADIYSLGMVLYELSNGGKLPFVEDLNYTSRYAAYQRRIEGEKLPPPQYVSSDLQRVILKACAYDPEERFQSATEMKKALLAVQKRARSEPDDTTVFTAPSETGPGVDPADSTGKKSFPRLFIWILITTAVLLLGIISIRFLLDSNRSDSEPAPAQTESITEALTDASAENRTEVLSEAPVQETVPESTAETYLGSTDLTDEAAVTHENTPCVISTQTTATAVTATPDNVSSEVSSDSEHILAIQDTTQQSVPVLSERYPGSEAHLRNTDDETFRVSSFTGPGKPFVSSGGYKPSKQKKITVYFEENGYVFADVVYQTVEERFVYLPKSAFDIVGNLPVLSDPEYYNGITTAEIVPSWGPDNRFYSVESLAVGKGVFIKIFFQENAFVYAEYVCEKGTVRMWLPANNIEMEDAVVTYSETPVEPAGKSSF